MNEELQKELLAILRAMKDGTPGVFDELIAQRASYCTVIASSIGVLFLIFAGLSILCLVGGIREKDYDAREGAFVGAAITGFLAVVAFAFALQPFAEAIAPLGLVLEALR